jgi:hypothetical protein
MISVRIPRLLPRLGFPNLIPQEIDRTMHRALRCLTIYRLRRRSLEGFDATNSKSMNGLFHMTAAPARPEMVLHLALRKSV